MPENLQEVDVENDCAKQHILIVDDDYDMTDLLKIALENSGFRTTIASDGNQGLAIAESKTPDLIILDIMMPRRSGFLVLERLRQNLEDPIPVIMVTGNFGERHRSYAEMLGVSGYFYKPVKLPLLIDKINELLDLDED
ncbi:MAG: response regulator transcription factor [Planctomycetota bacterium]